jgi:hypothetical protein
VKAETIKNGSNLPGELKILIAEQEDIKLVIGAGEYNNNPGWIHTQESEIDLLVEETWKNRFYPSSITAILLNTYGNISRLKKESKQLKFVISI